MSDLIDSGSHWGVTVRCRISSLLRLFLNVTDYYWVFLLLAKILNNGYRSHGSETICGSVNISKPNYKAVLCLFVVASLMFTDAGKMITQDTRQVNA